MVGQLLFQLFRLRGEGPQCRLGNTTLAHDKDRGVKAGRGQAQMRALAALVDSGPPGGGSAPPKSPAR
eukprot:1184662-Prorocentrum_minimum.AAC.4